ncbi:MAG: hypothetical protein IPM69_04280 [Ignavibacteria bacterium]|nr:hypothetical protein [Ignavibacteria bacterium]
MKTHGLLSIIMVALLHGVSVKAQQIEVGISPFALAYRLSSFGSESYNNAYSLLIEYGASDTSRLMYQVRYDVFDGNDQPLDGDDKSFQNLGLGVRYRLIDVSRFSLSGYTNVGILLSDPHDIRKSSALYRYDTTTKTAYRSRVPSLVNLSIGLCIEWYATEVVSPYIEASLLNSIKLQSDEKTQVELVAMRIGVRLKV